MFPALDWVTSHSQMVSAMPPASELLKLIQCSALGALCPPSLASLCRPGHRPQRDRSGKKNPACLVTKELSELSGRPSMVGRPSKAQAPAELLGS